MSFFRKVMVRSASASSASESIRAQAAALGSKDANLLQVEKKLRNIEQYKELEGRELQKMAESITNPEKILDYFSHLYSLDEIDDVNEDKADVFATSLEVIHAKVREKTRYVQAAKIPLKIAARDVEVNPKAKRILHTLADFIRMDYGAKHVALVVGDVVLEWSKESLVIPHYEDLADFEARDITEYCPHNAEAVPTDGPLLTIVEEVEKLVESTVGKVQTFERLAKVISKYNNKFYYDVTRRNCQTFVKDALEAIGISKKIPITHEISERVQQLRAKKLGEIPDTFAGHEDLDAYIKTKSQRWIERLDPDSLEFLQLSYMQFHGSGDAPCHVRSCQMLTLSEVLQKNLRN